MAKVDADISAIERMHFLSIQFLGKAYAANAIIRNCAKYLIRRLCISPVGYTGSILFIFIYIIYNDNDYEIWRTPVGGSAPPGTVKRTSFCSLFP